MLDGKTSVAAKEGLQYYGISMNEIGVSCFSSAWEANQPEPEPVNATAVFGKTRKQDRNQQE